MLGELTALFPGSGAAGGICVLSEGLKQRKGRAPQQQKELPFSY
jgi:hypothetical protein